MLEWTQTMLTVGEAFSGAESSTLRDAIARQSGRFFQAYHAGNLQVPGLCCSTGGHSHGSAFRLMSHRSGDMCQFWSGWPGMTSFDGKLLQLTTT